MSDLFVPMVLEDDDGGDLWIARTQTPEQAVARATEIGGRENWHPVPVYMRCGAFGDESVWEECAAGDEGAEEFWRMEVW